MPRNQESFNTSLYDLLKTRGYDPIPINSKGQNTPVPNDADVFKFEFTRGDKTYGDVWISIDKAQDLVVYYDDEIAKSDDDDSSTEPGKASMQSWSGLLRHLKNWAQRRQLGFELRNRDHLAADMAQREHMKKKEQLGEGYYPMGKKASYSDNVPQVKIILQHTRQIEEGEQRFRNVEKIFVENMNGERFLLPTKRPGLARVYARHIAEGGTPYDERGHHITSLVEEYTKMAGFVRATKNGQFNESAQRLVNEGVNHYNNLRETLTRMTGHRGYHKYFESYTPVLNEQSDEESSLNELFVQETLDPRIESVLPILNRLSKNITEMNEVKELEEWATEVVEDKLTEGWQSYYREWLESDFAPEDKDDQDELIEKATMFINDATLHRKSDEWVESKALDFVNKYLDDSFYSVNEMDQTTKTLAEPAADMLEDSVDEGALGQGGHKVSDRPYVCVHAKKGKFECHAETSYEAAKKAAQKWGLKSTAGIDVYLADVKHTPVNEAPGAETLAHNQSTEKKNLDAFDLEEEVSVKYEVRDKKGNRLGTWDGINFRSYDLTKYKHSDMIPPGTEVDKASGPMSDRDLGLVKAGIKEEGVSEGSDVKYFYVTVDGKQKFKTKDEKKARSMAEEMKKDSKFDGKNINVVEKSDYEVQVGEDLNADQKRVGQVGPTEKAKKISPVLGAPQKPHPFQGKLVGASESVELDKLKSLSGIK